MSYIRCDWLQFVDTCRCSSHCSSKENVILQDVAYSIEVAYKMTAELESCLKDYAATSHVFTMGQRVFLHNYDCQGDITSLRHKHIDCDVNSIHVA